MTSYNLPVRIWDPRWLTCVFAYNAISMYYCIYVCIGGWRVTNMWLSGVHNSPVGVPRWCIQRSIEVYYLLTYLRTPWSRVLLEKLASLQLVKKFPAFYGTRSFLTALTSVRHLSLSWASPIQSSYPNPTSWRSILILSSHLRLGLPSGLFPSGFPTSTLYTP